MSNKDIENKIANGFRIIELLHRYQEEFTGIFGSKGYWELIDHHLDDLNYWRAKLKKQKNEKDNNAGRNGSRH
ncbi:MAG TPA: hypothetical protein ENJ95_21450 [Bacteroidetes bacterium]|nr:hypothetical protein [Bacteroidota bacterium]